MDQQKQMIGKESTLDEKILVRLQELQVYIRREIATVRREANSRRDHQHGFGYQTVVDTDVWNVRAESYKSIEDRYGLELEHLDVLRSELRGRIDGERKKSARPAAEVDVDTLLDTVIQSLDDLGKRLSGGAEADTPLRVGISLAHLLLKKLPRK